jgi:hypothetical protein
LCTFVLFGLSFAAFTVGRGDWIAFFQSPARVGAFVVTLALCALAVFSDFGGMNQGKKEDRGNRWIFGLVIALSLGLAVLPPHLDGRNLWVSDEAVTPYVGLALLTLGGDAISYIRVSSEEQADSSLGLEAQRQRVTAYCAMKGLHFAKEFEDPGISAGKPLASRPAGSKLLAAARRGRLSWS